MSMLRATIAEILGLFIDDGSLALFVVILIALVTAAVKLAGLPPLWCGLALLIGCVVLLMESLQRAVHSKRR